MQQTHQLRRIVVELRLVDTRRLRLRLGRLLLGQRLRHVLAPLPSQRSARTEIPLAVFLVLQQLLHAAELQLQQRAPLLVRLKDHAMAQYPQPPRLRLTPRPRPALSAASNHSVSGSRRERHAAPWPLSLWSGLAGGRD
eukprot:COSAG02_NODE_5983_length_3891_cov_1159.797732_4_plen_139_part_00